MTNKIIKICVNIEFSIENLAKYISKDEVGFTGLINNSSLCYMNSVF
jgi:ubiquitin carboxyl-terminal hydrolase 7